MKRRKRMVNINWLQRFEFTNKQINNIIKIVNDLIPLIKKQSLSGCLLKVEKIKFTLKEKLVIAAILGGIAILLSYNENFSNEKSKI